MASRLRTGPGARFHRLVGVGGIGTGLVFALEGDHDLGRNESRPARLLDVRDYCKLHIIAHYPAALLGARASGDPFHVVPVGRVGADGAGRRLTAEMAEVGMDVRYVEAVADRPTQLSVCFQYPDGSGANVTTTESAASALGASDLDLVADLLDERTIALAAPEIPLPARRRLLDLATARGSFRVLALASSEVPDASDLLSRADLVALNEDEAAALAGQRFDPARTGEFLKRVQDALAVLQPSASLLVTAGPEGAYGFDTGSWTRCPALAVPVAGTAGAGDALLGGVLAGLAAGLPFTHFAPLGARAAPTPIASALELGSCLAAFAVTSPHTIPPGVTLDLLLSFARDHGLTFDDALRVCDEVPA